MPSSFERAANRLTCRSRTDCCVFCVFATDHVHILLCYRFAPSARPSFSGPSFSPSQSAPLFTSLYLLVKKGEEWNFPYEQVRTNDISMRSAAEGAVSRDGLESYFFGNGPVGFRASALPDKEQKVENLYVKFLHIPESVLLFANYFISQLWRENFLLPCSSYRRG